MDCMHVGRTMGSLLLLSLTVIEAPRSTSNRQISVWPFSAASCSGMRRSVSAPAWMLMLMLLTDSSSSTMAMWPQLHASCSGALAQVNRSNQTSSTRRTSRSCQTR